MTGRIIAAGLKARPVRTSVTVLAVALEVTLILSIVGLVNGMIKGTVDHVTEVGADVMLFPPGGSLILGMNNAVLPETLGPKLETFHHVAAVTPIIVESSLGQGASENVWGIDLDSYNHLTGGFRYLEGGPFAADDEIVIDDLLAAKLKLRVGSTTQFLNRKYRVAGIVAHGRGARVFMKLRELQKIKDAFTVDDKGNRIGKVTFFFIKLTSRDNYEDFRREYVLPAGENDAPLLKEYNVVSVADFAQLFNNTLPGLDEFRAVIVFISMCVGVLVIFLSTYTAITERTREIGVLRSLGATRGLIVKLVIAESLLLCAAGAAIGTGSSFAIAHIVKYFLPTQNLEITGGWIVLAIGFALLSGVLGSLYPALKAAKQDPIEALAYE